MEWKVTFWFTKHPQCLCPVWCPFLTNATHYIEWKTQWPLGQGATHFRVKNWPLVQADKTSKMLMSSIISLSHAGARHTDHSDRVRPVKWRFKLHVYHITLFLASGPGLPGVLRRRMQGDCTRGNTKWGSRLISTPGPRHVIGLLLHTCMFNAACARRVTCTLRVMSQSRKTEGGS